MPAVELSYESLEIALVFWCGFVRCLFKLGVANVGFAMFAPVFGLSRMSVNAQGANVMTLTVDFQYSDIVAAPRTEKPPRLLM